MEWNGWAEGKTSRAPSNPYKPSHSIPWAPQGERRVKAAGVAPIVSTFERRGADVRAAETNTSALLPAENTNSLVPLMFAHPA